MTTARFSLFLSLLLFASCSSKDTRPNVLLVIIDTVNAKHLGCYGYERNTSPFIDSLASSGIRYVNCQAQAPWTLPATATILTGLTERSHGCSRYGGVSHGLDPEVPTLASILSFSGYTTATFVNNGYLGPDFGLDRGYGSYWMGTDSVDYAHVTIDSAMHFLDTLNTGRPFYLKLHLFDPHLPYDPPAPFDTLFKSTGTAGYTVWPSSQELWNHQVVIDHMRAMYDSELRWTDSQLERLFQHLRDKGLVENTLIVLIADHGEEFMEHGDWGHAHNLYQQALHVPLIITGPGLGTGVVENRNAGQFDVLPTILDYLGIPAPEHTEGISLLGEIPDNRIIPSSGVIADTASASVLSGSIKVLWFVEPDSAETYDLASDPGETEALPLDSILFDEVTDYWAWPCICTPTAFEENLIENRRLESLGYIR